MESSSLPDQRRFVEEGTSAVGEAGREDPIVGSGEDKATEGMLVAGGKNRVMGAESSNWLLPLPLPEQDEDWHIPRYHPGQSTDKVSRRKLQR